MYSLELTEADVETIAFVGYRYCWSEILAPMEAGVNEITEGDAWRIQDAFGSDMEGGHNIFPLLDAESDLASKLFKLLMEII